MPVDEIAREWRPDWPCPVGAILGAHRRGGGDPTYRVIGDDVWRGIGTPEGPATLAVRAATTSGVVEARAWGEGAAWALDSLPALLGADDDPSGFTPPEQLQQTWRRHRHWRVGRTGLVMESLVPTIIEQKVTGQEAFGSFRTLVRRFGRPAPGPGETHDLWVQPDAATLRQVPSWEWLKLSIDSGRSRPLMAAVRVADSLERAGRESPEEFERRLRTLPGIGGWTSAEVRARALGDADAVSFGDYHVAKDVTWALTGVQGDDEALAELLEPYRPHRGRVVALVQMAGLGRPRRGARMAPRRHLPGSRRP